MIVKFRFNGTHSETNDLNFGIKGFGYGGNTGYHYVASNFLAGGVTDFDFILSSNADVKKY